MGSKAVARGSVQHVGRKLARVIDARRPGRHDLACELLDGRLEIALFVGEVEVHKATAEDAETAEILPLVWF